METSELLRQTVAEFFDVNEGRVGPSFSLQARQGSIARAALDAAIRGRLGLKSRAVYRAKTYGELEAELAPGGPAAPTVPDLPPKVATAQAEAGSAPGASCGVDLELVANLPASGDPWEDDFYRAHFTASEIAYCLRQPDPGPHFAARWCAKEALKKCDRAFLAADPKDIEVVPDEAGAPHLEYHGGGRSRRLPHAVSLSHTPGSAVAVVVRVEPPPAPPAPIPDGPAPAIPAPGPPGPPARRRGGRLLVALNLIAIGLAALALARTFPGFRWPFPG